MNAFVHKSPWIQKALEKNLQSGEEPSWLGAPSMKIFTIEDLPLVIFGLFWTLISMMVTLFGSSCSNWLVSEPVLRPQGIPVILIGVFLLAAPLWRIRRELHTAYVITNLRAMILQGEKRTAVSSFWPEHLKEVTHATNSDGTGSILIAKRSYGTDEDGNVQFVPMGFFRLRDWKMALGLIKTLAKKPDFL